MAQRARFGRLPRSAPSLTSTIVALAQEYQHTRDRNIETAWKEGGLFEGKKVTDQAFLKHWEERMKGVSPDDPMHDYYHNLIYGYQFMVEESKMGLKYAREDVTDGEMAAFYAKWARKMPMNSQNYRQLMTQAAKFKAASTARGHASSAAGATNRYNAAQNRTYRTHEQPYDTAVQLISNYAVTRNILDSADVVDSKGNPTPDHGWAKLTNADGTGDPANFANLLSDLMDDPDARKAMTAAIRANGNPDFNGTFSEETITAMANTARNGAGIAAHRAQKAGDVTGQKAARARANSYALQSAVTRTALAGPKGAQAGFIEQNEYNRSQLDAVLGTEGEPSHASDQEMALAIQDYGDWLAGEGRQMIVSAFPKGSFDPLSPNFDIHAAGVLSRVQGTLDSLSGRPTGKTLKDDTFGLSTNEAGEGSDAWKLGHRAAAAFQAVDSVAKGAAIVVKTDVDGNIDPHGQFWSTIERASPRLVGKDIVPFATPAMGSMQLADGTVVGGDQGEVRYTMAEEVRAHVSTATDPRTGRGVAESKPVREEDPILGKHISYVGPGGSTIDLWSVVVNGRDVWTSVDPFDAGPSRSNAGSDGKGKYIINYQPPPPAAGAAGAAAPTVMGGGTAQKIPQYNPNKFITNLPKVNINGVDSSDGTAWDPNTDNATGFDSPMAAAAHSSSAAMQWVSKLGDTAVAAAERDWYSNENHYTPEMQQAINAGADPNQVIAQQSQKLMQTINYNRTYGFTPEDQQANRSREAQAQLVAGAAQAGVSVAEFKARQGMADDEITRQDLIAKVNKWGLANRGADIYGPRRGDMFTGPTVTQQNKVEEWAKKGWSVADLLAQPGMSLTQANDLAAQITNGVVGQRGKERGPNELPWSHPKPTPEYGMNTPYANPYLPGGAVAQKPLGPAKPVQPKPVKEAKPTQIKGKLVKTTFSGSDWGVQLTEGGPTAY